MKTVNSGIIRRMDDLGRVVIPKEMRRMANIKEGDYFEVGFANGCIVLEKFQGEIDKETGLPKPQVNEGSPVKVVNKEPKKYYVDVCNRRVFVEVKDIAKVMIDNGDIPCFEDWLSENYNAGNLYDILFKGGFDITIEKLKKEYEEFVMHLAQELLDCLYSDDYIKIVV